MSLYIKAGAMLIALASTFVVQANEYVLKKVAKPTYQSVNLNLDPNLDTFTGSTKINIEVLKPTHVIEVNGVDYSIDEAVLVGETSCDLDSAMNDKGIVSLGCGSEIVPGKYQLNLTFTAPYNRNAVGLYKTIDGGLPYLFTQFEMSDARRAFPLFDEPEYKIPFQLTIRSPKSEKVYSNTPVVSETLNGNWITHEFAPTQVISSYLVALAVGQFEEIPVKGMSVPGRVITTKGKIELAKYAAQKMPVVLAALEDYFGSSYPFEKLDSVAVPEFPFGAMENAGLVTYREDILLLDENNASDVSKRRAISIIGHELAHQWYGNLVTMAWWNDLWLNEAFASWMAAKITYQTHPEFETHLSMSRNRAMPADARLSTKPIRKPIRTEADIMDGLGLAYSKGEAVLSMVENWIGEEAFKQGIRDYIKTYSYKNTQASDLWNTLAKASGKDVPSVLQSFIEQSSYPLIKVTQQGNKITLSQQSYVYAEAKAPEQKWVLPVVLKYGVNGQTFEKSVLLSKRTLVVELEAVADWIYPDANAMGYYRWTLSPENFEKLLANVQQLSDRERRAMISSADALLDGGFLSAGNLLKILEEFTIDPHPAIVSSAISYIDRQKLPFVDEKNQQQWSNFIAQSLLPIVERYGMVVKTDEDPQVSQLRSRVVDLLAFEAKQKNIIEVAANQTGRFLAGDNNVDPYLIGTYLTIAMYHGDAKLLNQMIKVFEQTKDPTKRTQILRALGYAPQGTLQQQVLNYSLTDAIKAPDLGYLYLGQSYQAERQSDFRSWAYEHYTEIANKLPPFALPRLLELYGGGCDLDNLATATQFFGQLTGEVPGYTRAIAKLEESVQTCSQLRLREKASVDSYLRQF
ncbi:M1 family metallopeptidase [Shewanella waksmanii]|uniref:M1 family metallopeptidase n=1 Tax=Shewanella waksmanii TaxID=213783 RepID=UPI0037369B59